MLCSELNGTEEDNVGVAGVGGRGVSGDDVPPYTVKFHVARMYLTLPSNIEPLVSDGCRERNNHNTYHKINSHGIKYTFLKTPAR